MHMDKILYVHFAYVYIYSGSTNTPSAGMVFIFSNNVYKVLCVRNTVLTQSCSSVLVDTNKNLLRQFDFIRNCLVLPKMTPIDLSLHENVSNIENISNFCNSVIDSA